MSELILANIGKNIFPSDCAVAYDVYHQIKQTEREECWAIPILYKMGVIAGQRMERARKKAK